MVNSVYIIDTHTEFNALLGTLRFTGTGELVRLEQRLNAVFLLLVTNANQLVTREQFVAEVWDNYGGAEDMLNQSISQLRKIIQDQEKKTIITVPKKGYMLRAMVQPLVREKRQKARWPKTVFAATACSIVVLTGVLWWNSARDTRPSTPSVDFREVQKVNLENESNSVSTTDSAGTTYKVVAIGDSRPQLFINGRQASEEELEKNKQLLNQLLLIIWSRQ